MRRKRMKGPGKGRQGREGAVRAGMDEGAGRGEEEAMTSKSSKETARVSPFEDSGMIRKPSCKHDAI